MKNELLEKYRYLKEHKFEVPAEKTWTEEYMYNILDSMDNKELEAEINFLEEYIKFLKLHIN